MPLIEQVLSRGVIIDRVLADGGYDSYGTFDFLNEHGIEAGIKMHKDATTRSRGWSKARPMAVQERDTLGQEAWVVRYQYSLRWMIEYVFSAVKGARQRAEVASSRPHVL